MLKTQVEDLEKKTKQLQNVNNMSTEQLTMLETEKMTYKSQLESTVPKLDFYRIERERDTLSENYKHMKDQLEELEERHNKLLTQRKSAGI